MVPIEQIRLQTNSTERSDRNGRLLGGYLSLKYRRPEAAAAASLLVTEAAMPVVKEDEDDI
jgi:hypothetical protein